MHRNAYKKTKTDKSKWCLTGTGFFFFSPKGCWKSTINQNNEIKEAKKLYNAKRELCGKMRIPFAFLTTSDSFHVTHRILWSFDLFSILSY